MQFRAPLTSLVVLLSLSTPAFALPGEAAAVIQHCGAPKAEEQVTSQVTSRLERNLYYADDLILHFQPSENGWSFTTAWHGHLPMTRDQLEARMPCFKTAMEQAAAQPLPYVDPSIAAQTALQPVDSTTFGIAHLWLIGGLVAVLVLLLFIFPVTKRNGRAAKAAELLRTRFLRKPSLVNQKPVIQHPLTKLD